MTTPRQLLASGGAWNQINRRCLEQAVDASIRSRAVAATLSWPRGSEGEEAAEPSGATLVPAAASPGRLSGSLGLERVFRRGELAQRP